MNDKLLAVYCERELNHFHGGDATTDDYCVELLRRMTEKDHLETWEHVKKCLRETVRGWIELHPRRTLATHLNSEESYVAQAFDRFYQAVVSNRVQFRCLAEVLHYLQAHLNGVMLDTLRAYSQPQEIRLSHPGEGEGASTTNKKRSEIWEHLKQGLSDRREQRIAFLLFHCGLSPDTIVQSCAEEFHDVQEIISARHRILKQMLSSGTTFFTAE